MSISLSGRAQPLLYDPNRYTFAGPMALTTARLYFLAMPTTVLLSMFVKIWCCPTVGAAVCCKDTRNTYICNYGNFSNNNLKAERASVRYAIKVAGECRVAHAEQVMAPLLAAYRNDDAGQDGGNEHVTEAALGADGLQPAVCFQSSEGTRESLP